MSKIQIKVPMEEMRKNKLFLAVPMYGGMCTGMFTKSVSDLAAKCAVYGIELKMYYLFNESLIPRARNYCVDEFMRSSCTHFMFIDADIGFNPDDVIALLALQMTDPDKYNVIGGPYPKKCISWEKIKMAVDKGFADEDPTNLDKYVGDYVFNPKSNQREIPLGEPVEVLEIGTGFMMISRQTFDTFKEAFPQYSYKPDHVRSEHFDGSREITMFFQSEIDPTSKRYLSEDYWFCQKLQEIGLKTWICPWMKLHHAGTMTFGGSLIDIAQLGPSATVDVDKIKKKKSPKK